MGALKLKGIGAKIVLERQRPLVDGLEIKNDGELLVLEGLYAGFQVVAKFFSPT